MGVNPPDWQGGPVRRRPRTLWSDLAGLWDRYRSLALLPRLIIFTIFIVVLVALYSILLRDDDGTTVSTRTTTTVRRLVPAPTTSTTAAVPAGEDAAVKSVLDGDSFETSDGTKIRLIGIDAPDVETDACFSADATRHLTELLPAGRTVRVVYDTTRTDRFGRTLAYIYRLPDGVFVNVALVRDGFATALTTAPNTAHAAEIEAAEDEARNARRGLWQSCQTTTTRAPAPATTEPEETPETTEPEETTTTEVTDPAATSTTPGPTSTVP